MNANEAAWVRTNVWRKDMKARDDEYRARRHLPGVGYKDFCLTPCQLGVCPSCLGKSRKPFYPGCQGCTTRLRIIDPFPDSPDIVYRWDLPVLDSRGDKVADLLLSCQGWVCPCGCWRDAIRPGGQLALEVA